MFEMTPSPLLSEVLCSWPTFEQQLNALLRSGQDHMLLYMDIDYLALADDSEAQPDVLAHVIPLLRVEMREHDKITQLGPQRLGILLEGYSTESALQLARVLRTKMQHSFFNQQDCLFRVGVSIGLVPLKYQYGSFSHAIETAANACQLAQLKGRNCIYLHQPKTLSHLAITPLNYQTA